MQIINVTRSGVSVEYDDPKWGLPLSDRARPSPERLFELLKFEMSFDEALATAAGMTTSDQELLIELCVRDFDETGSIMPRRRMRPADMYRFADEVAGFQEHPTADSFLLWKEIQGRKSTAEDLIEEFYALQECETDDLITRCLLAHETEGADGWFRGIAEALALAAGYPSVDEKEWLPGDGESGPGCD